MDLSSLTGLLVGAHALLANLTEQPVWELTEDEGTRFLKSAQNVMRHYNVQTTQKTLDWIAFMGVGAAIYGPRVITSVNEGTKKPPVQSSGPKVVPLHSMPQPAASDIHPSLGD